jgi:hypothetical protein
VDCLVVAIQRAIIIRTQKDAMISVDYDYYCLHRARSTDFVEFMLPKNVFEKKKEIIMKALPVMRARKKFNSVSFAYSYSLTCLLA